MEFIRLKDYYFYFWSFYEFLKLEKWMEENIFSIFFLLPPSNSSLETLAISSKGLWLWFEKLLSSNFLGLSMHYWNCSNPRTTTRGFPNK